MNEAFRVSFVSVTFQLIRKLSLRVQLGTVRLAIVKKGIYLLKVLFYKLY